MLRLMSRLYFWCRDSAISLFVQYRDSRIDVFNIAALFRCCDISLKWRRDKIYVVITSLLSQLMWCRHSDPYVLLLSADVTTLTDIANVETLFTQCHDFDMMSRHSLANSATLDFWPLFASCLAVIYFLCYSCKNTKFSEVSII